MVTHPSGDSNASDVSPCPRGESSRGTERLFSHLPRGHSQGCIHFATFVNRINETKYDDFVKLSQQSQYNIYLLKEIQELDMPTIEDVRESLQAKSIVLNDDDHSRVIRGVKVAALTLENFLEHIEEDDLVIVPADRSEIILGLYGALHSNTYANISVIIFPFDMKIHPNIQKLIDGLENFKIPILSVATDTYNTAKNVMHSHARLRVNAERKIALALGLFNSSVDVKKIEEKIATTYSEIMTPQMFKYKLFNRAHADKKTIVLPESNDERILRASEIILRRDVANIILIADAKELRERYLRLGLDLGKATIVDHLNSPYLEEFTDAFYEKRKHKGITKEMAQDSMMHVSYFATMMVELGYADGMVSGATHSTADTMRPALQIIKTAPDINIVSSLFFMCFETKVLVYGDCAINQDPNASQLADIAIASAKTAKIFKQEIHIDTSKEGTSLSSSHVPLDPDIVHEF